MKTKEKKILDALKGVREEYIEESAPGKRVRKSRGPVRWAALAACACLVVALAFGIPRIVRNTEIPGGGAGSLPGGGDEGGAEPGGTGGNYSVAVYPAGEREEDVASAVVNQVTEEDLSASSLSTHLPASLLDGYHFGRGSLYTTVMKDGTTYEMLRIEYITGNVPEQQFTEDGGAIAPDLGAMGEMFLLCVWNFDPDPEETVYASAEEVPLSVLEEKGSCSVRAGDCCVKAFVELAEPAVVLETLQSVS